MRKLIIILPVLVLALVSFGVAAGETIDQMIPFAETSDDGGALGEKAKVNAMREALKSGNLHLLVTHSDEQLHTHRLATATSLTAIREEEV